MSVNVYLSGNPVHDAVLRTFYFGIPLSGKRLLSVNNYDPSDVAVVFGAYKRSVPISFARAKIARLQKEAGKDVIVMDSGYVRRGMTDTNYYSCGFNDINGWAEFRNEHMPRDRWDALETPLVPWRLTGKHILLCGQVPWDSNCRSVNMPTWLVETAKGIRKYSDREIFYRPHPMAVNASPLSVVFCKTSTAPLEEDLRGAWAAVTWNSNAGVDAALAGIPVFTLGDGAMSTKIANTKLQRIENPNMPDRTQWARDLAYTQWTPKEMSGGLAWNHLYR